MKILVQDPISKKYLKTNGEWTAALTEARDFPVTTLAFDVAKHIISGRFQVVLQFTESEDVVDFIDGIGRGTLCAA